MNESCVRGVLFSLYVQQDKDTAVHSAILIV